MKEIEKNVKAEGMQAAAAFREQKDISRLRLMHETGVGYPTLTALEQGGGIALGNACRVAMYFRVPIHALFSGPIPNQKNNYNQYRDALTEWQQDPSPKAGYITGLEYHRRKQRLTKRQLAKMAGVTPLTLTNLEHQGLSPWVHASEALALASAMGIAVDDLLVAHRRSELTAGDRGAWPAEGKTPTNLLDNYRVKHNLTYREMSRRLNLTCQGAIVACDRKQARKQHVEKLSELEGMSTWEFMDIYGRCSESQDSSREESSVQANASYYIDYHTGAGDFLATGTLEDAMREADQAVAYTQCAITIFDAAHERKIAERPWWGVPYSEDSVEDPEDVISFENWGYYGEWVVL